MRSRLSIITALALLALVLALPFWPAQASPAPEATSVGATALLSELAAAAPAAKVDADLLTAAKQAPNALIHVFVLSAKHVDLGDYADRVHQFTWPAGEHVSMLRVLGGRVESIAAEPGVYAVLSGELDQRVAATSSPSHVVDGSDGIDIERVRAEARGAAPWSAASAAATDNVVDGFSGGDGEALGWYDIKKGHAAEEAWKLGYRGEGVRVSVHDFAVDYAHPDMQGTWPVLPEGHPYDGWPQVFDPNAGYLAALDLELPDERKSTRTAGNGYIELYQTSQVTVTNEATATSGIACFQPGFYDPNVPFTLGPPMCDFVVPLSASGEVKFGHHPDSGLTGYGALPELGVVGQWPGVLMVDPTEEGVYDTVYVDIDGDHDFTDEKPLTKDDPLSWRDNNGDGLADLTAGLMYWISDGEQPFPVSWMWGLEENIPQAYSAVGFLWASGDHGTMCASNVVSQGVLKVPENTELRFRDLPGDGQPESTNLGLAPGAGLVSVGSVYSGFDPIHSASWRYAVTGHELDRDDDDIQVSSNSYGWSWTDHDGWDYDSRLVDYYVRQFNDTVSLLYSTGNGGPGYGTFAPPGPATSMGIASSTQQGSTIAESITDTTQITFGDIIPFSNRGPSTNGHNAVSVAANGASGTGAYPINMAGDGASANTSWGGTSRSAPAAAGAMALVYEAFHEANDRWPTWSEAQAILMSGARHAGYDTFVQGAGVVDAADAVRIASGSRGLYATPAEWTPGDYRDEVYPAFAKIMSPGDVATSTITLNNPTDRPITAEISGQTMTRLGFDEQALVTDRTLQSPAGRTPDYLVEIDRTKVPTDTELLVVRGAYPMPEFDVDGNMTADNVYVLYVLQHTDINGNGELWNDANGNGVVDHAMSTDLVSATWDGSTEDYEAIEGAITAPLTPGEAFTGTLGWLGRSCPSQGDEAESDVSAKVALIARGDCTFNEKMRFAQDNGATGVVMFTDARAKIAMGGDSAGVDIPGMMIDNAPGQDLRDLLIDGTTVDVELYTTSGVGITGASPVDWSATEMEQYEFKAFNVEDDQRNHWAVAVHHPHERWADGMYVGLRHLTRTDAVTNTHVSLRFDYYAYEPWEGLTVSEPTVWVPPGETMDVEAMMRVDEDAAAGTYQGALFVDYSREPESMPTVYLPSVLRGFAGWSAAEAGDEPEPVPDDSLELSQGDDVDMEAELLPGGYELPNLRTVIPVNVNVASEYDWTEALTFGGDEGYDPDARYNNGAMWGTFKWNWRAESGDWRYFFYDVLEVPDNAYWLHRTTWDEALPQSSDIDTRIYGPTMDRFSDPDDPANREEDMSDPLWYGPYTLDLSVRSPYLASGSRWPFNTSSGGDEDWLMTPAVKAGLHEVMLHNVLFGGSSLDLPFKTEVGSMVMSTDTVKIVGDVCGDLVITSTLEFNPLHLNAFGVSEPIVLVDEPIEQDDPNDVTSAGFKYDVTIENPAGRFVVELEGLDGDDLDLFILYDLNNDGEFSHPQEMVGQSTTPTGVERVELAGVQPPGAYQVWVHGFGVTNEDSTFDMLIDVVSGDAVFVKDAPESISPGNPVTLEVCANLDSLEGVDGPASGIITIGNDGKNPLLQVPVMWQREP